tara:strand:- start:6047 stop:7243 length:1197 start_codon:yes stop_codon:yes gene_type:complete
MARLEKVDLGNSIEAWRQKTNLTSSYIGDLDTLTTTDSDTICGALNSIEAKIITAATAKALFSSANSGPGSYVTLSYDNTTGVTTLTRNSLVEGDIPNLNASKITQGSFGNSQLSDIDASKVNAGTLATARMPDLDAAKITTSQFHVDRIPSIPASKINSGTLDASVIPNIPAHTVVHGTPVGDSGAVPKGSLPSDLVYTGGDYIGSTPQVMTSAMTFNGVNIFGGIITANAASVFNSTVEINEHITTTTNETKNIGAAANQFATVFATTFEGTASRAKYADLAENYTTDKTHITGTVMMVSYNNTEETCECNASGIPAGIVSENPAYLMNADTEGQSLALKGRVPVRIMGPVNKGEAVFCWQKGCASTQFNGAHMIGIALETNQTETEKLVECLLKL